MIAQIRSTLASRDPVQLPQFIISRYIAMKKVLLIGVLVLLLAAGYFGVAPIIVNKLIEKNLPDFAARIADQSNVELKDTRYESALTGGTFYTTIHPIGLPSQAQVKLKHEISTFPIYTKIDNSRGLALATVKSTISHDNFSPEDLEQLTALFKNQTPAILETVVDYSRNYHLSLTINPAQDPNESILFSGLTGNFDISNDGTKINGQARMQQLNFTSKEGAVSLTDLETHVDQTKNDAGLWIGTSDLKINRIEGRTFMDKFSIHQAGMKASFIDRSETVEYLINLDIPEIDMPNVSPIAINALNYKFGINNIHSLAAAKLFPALQDLQQKLLTGTPSENEQSMRNFGTQNSASIDQLLRSDPHMTQNLILTTAQGSVNIDLDLNFTGFSSDQSIAGIEAPEQLIRYLSGTFHAKSPLALLQTTPLAPQLAMVQQQGLLKIEGNSASFNAALKDRQLTVNDQPFPLPF